MENKTTIKEGKKAKGIWKKIGLFLILLFLFFWFFIRPSSIKSSCSKQARENTLKTESKTMNLYNDYYTICLRDKGL